MSGALNPALQEARFCPRCGKEAQVAYPRSISCPHCGYGAYYNPKPVAAAIPVTAQGEVVLLRRGFDPGKGLWTFPGGFVDLGETVEEAAQREAREEIEADVELGGLVGVYSRPDERVVLIVFQAQIATEPRPTPEAPEVQAFARDQIPWDDRVLVDHPGAPGFPLALTAPHQRDSPAVDDAVFIGGPEKRAIVIEDYDPAWTARFEQAQAALKQALQDKAHRIEHFGSTAVPGLAAKGIIDVMVTVDDADDEADYGPPLEQHGFHIRVRQPGHRMYRTPDQDVHVHVFTHDSEAAKVRLLFRDWLRHDDNDRRLYEETKRDLARKDWDATNDYSEAKGAVVAEILVRAHRWARD